MGTWRHGVYGHGCPHSNVAAWRHEVYRGDGGMPHLDWSLGFVWGGRHGSLTSTVQQI